MIEIDRKDDSPISAELINELDDFLRQAPGDPMANKATVELLLKKGLSFDQIKVFLKGA